MRSSAAATGVAAAATCAAGHNKHACLRSAAAAAPLRRCPAAPLRRCAAAAPARGAIPARQLCRGTCRWARGSSAGRPAAAARSGAAVGTKATQGTTLPIRLPTDSSSAVVSLPAAPRDAASPAHAKEAGRGPAVACARRGGGGRAADERAGGWTQAGAGCAASTPERDRKRRCAPWSPHLATRPPDESDTGQYKKQYYTNRKNGSSAGRFEQRSAGR